MLLHRWRRVLCAKTVGATSSEGFSAVDKWKVVYSYPVFGDGDGGRSDRYIDVDPLLRQSASVDVVHRVVQYVNAYNER